MTTLNVSIEAEYIPTASDWAALDSLIPELLAHTCNRSIEDDSWMLEVMDLESEEILDDGTPAYLYQVSENAWTAEAIESPLSTWLCVDRWAGIYELQGNPSTCEPHSFIRVGEFWDMGSHPQDF